MSFMELTPDQITLRALYYRWNSQTKPKTYQKFESKYTDWLSEQRPTSTLTTEDLFRRFTGDQLPSQPQTPLKQNVPLATLPAENNDLSRRSKRVFGANETAQPPTTLLKSSTPNSNAPQSAPRTETPNPFSWIFALFAAIGTFFKAIFESRSE